MNLELAAELVMTIEGYDYEEKEIWNDNVDLTASDEKSDEKILLRVINNPESNSGMVGVDTVTKMAETIEQKDYDKGVLIGERFSSAARKAMTRKNIQMISDRFMQPFKPQKLYLTIQDCIDGLCKAKCGRVPKKESDCDGRDYDGNYSCKIRLVSDDSSFHFQHGWTNLLREDLKRLLILRKLIDHQDDGDQKNV